jgi:hypothetical protein
MYHTVGLKVDGIFVIVRWGRGGQWAVEDWTAIVQVAAGGSTVGAKPDGSVVTTGAEVGLAKGDLL